MKYLIINGSPHRGNTWTVVQAAMKRIKELDANYTAEEIHLMEARIPFCTGCSNCFRLGGEFCPHRDIMSEIQTKIEAADGIIVATTTFNCRETALLKNFLDHLNYLLHRPRFFNKKALVVTTVGGVGGNATIKSVTGTLRGMGFNKCYSMFIRSVSWNDYRINTSDQKKISREAEKFYTDLKSGKMHYPTILFSLLDYATSLREITVIGCYYCYYLSRFKEHIYISVSWKLNSFDIVEYSVSVYLCKVTKFCYS